MGSKKTANEQHIEGLDAYKKHNAHGTGCVMRCTSAYQPGKAHSHRWNAAERARGESDIPYNDIKMWEKSQEVDNWTLKKLQNLQKEGGLAGAITKKGSKHLGNVKPFYRSFHPFNHNAHHIIPIGIMLKAIINTSKSAKPNVTRMENLILGGLIDEPYNINDQPNMIVLPTQLKPAEILHLPIHLDNKRWDHPAYSRKIKTHVEAKFKSEFASLCGQVAAEKHDDKKDHTTPAMESSLETISNSMYKAIIGLAKAGTRVGENLDAVGHALACRFARIIAG